MASPSEEYVATDAGEPTLTRAPPRHGNTCEGRLRVLDAFLQAYDPPLFDEGATSASADGPVDIFMDVGLGDGPWTLLEFADLLAARRNSGTLKVVGTECDPERLAAAVAALPDPRPPMLDLRLAETTGWFRLPVLPTETLLCLRVMNVLRDYHPADAQRAFGVLAAQLPAGALMVEGTCDGDGPGVRGTGEPVGGRILARRPGHRVSRGSNAAPRNRLPGQGVAAPPTALVPAPAGLDARGPPRPERSPLLPNPVGTSRGERKGGRGPGHPPRSGLVAAVRPQTRRRGPKRRP